MHSEAMASRSRFFKRWTPRIKALTYGNKSYAARTLKTDSHALNLFPRHLNSLSRHRGRTPSLRWIIAGLTHHELGVSYDEACELLLGVPAVELSDFEESLYREENKKIVFSNRQISIFDSFSGSDILRTLHFNQRPNLVQVHINKCITSLIHNT